MTNLQTSSEEIWKDIPGYEGLYQISNLGRAKGLACTFPHKYCGYSTRSERILKQRKRSKQDGGYTVTKLKNKSCYVHTLVALAFIDNPNNYSQVNHIDGDEYNNNVKNLEWCSGSQNIKHSYDIGIRPLAPLILNPKKLSDSPRAKKVIQLTREGKFVKEWGCMTEAALFIGHKTIDTISKCAKGTKKSAGGYLWKFYKP